MSLLELSKKDSYWRSIALKICRNKFMADDIVQEMYLKLCNNDKDKNDFYVIIVMRNIFLDTIKKDKMLTSLASENNIQIKQLSNGFNDNDDKEREMHKIDFFDVEDKSINHKFEYSDNEQKFIDNLKWYEKELIELTSDYSFREIEKIYNINYQFVRRILNKTKVKWQEQKF
jgi:RNA polymerase sigma factor (sigma-70 family)